MLQRIQSIYLLLAALVVAALFIFPLVHNVYVNGETLSVMVTGTYQDINGQSISKQPFTALTVGTAFTAILPLIVIFMYNNRKRQIIACYVTMVAMIAYSYWASSTVKAAIGDAQLSMSNYGIGILLLSVSLVLMIAAQKSIDRDEKLVRSADRLR